MLLTRPVLSADDATGIALLNCLVREVCVPEHQVRRAGRHLVLRLPRVGVVLRAGLRRTPCGPSYPLATPIEEQRGSAWLAVDWRRLADLTAGELELATGRANPEFIEQVAAGHTAMAALIEARERARDHGGTADRFIESEQALVAGHRFHPAPKARQGSPSEWLPYAPEARARFRLRWLALRDDLVAEEGDLGPLERLGPPVPPGYRTLPVHPWQFSLLAGRPALRSALADRAVLDLGAAGPEAVPTSSVRTVYLPDADLFCKFSLDVRITNCVRKNAWYELIGAVTLNRLLGPVFGALGAAFDGCALLAEPAYRTFAPAYTDPAHMDPAHMDRAHMDRAYMDPAYTDPADMELHEGLGVIVRSGVRGHAGTPLLAAALADPYASSPAALARLLAGASLEDALAWWDGYVRLVAPPVLHAFLAHGVVLEPHLQNVLIAVDDADRPVQVIFRDLEGTKLVAGDGVHPDLAGLPPRVQESLTYEAGHGWSRVVYCLVVNHLAEVAAAVADLHPGAEPQLWRLAHLRIERYAREHSGGLAPAGAARLRALLAGIPLPGKANLRTRWERAADSRASYVAVPSPFGAR